MFRLKSFQLVALDYDKSLRFLPHCLSEVSLTLDFRVIWGEEDRLKSNWELAIDGIMKKKV